MASRHLLRCWLLVISILVLVLVDDGHTIVTAKGTVESSVALTRFRPDLELKLWSTMSSTTGMNGDSSSSSIGSRPMDITPSSSRRSVTPQPTDVDMASVSSVPPAPMADTFHPGTGVKSSKSSNRNQGPFTVAPKTAFIPRQNQPRPTIKQSTRKVKTISASTSAPAASVTKKSATISNRPLTRLQKKLQEDRDKAQELSAVDLKWVIKDEVEVYTIDAGDANPGTGIEGDAISSSLSSSTSSHALISLQVHTGGATPVVSRGLDKGGLKDTRASLRNAKQSDPKTLNDFIYLWDSVGRVISAIGVVAPKKRNSLSAAAYQICDRMWYQEKKTARPRKDWQTGHIIASALGGDDKDPMNFFPQHHKSNSGGGIWWQTELIAGGGAKLYQQQKLKDPPITGNDCEVVIKAKLEYTGTSVIPTEGTYTIITSNVCWKQAQALSTSQLATVRHSSSFVELMNHKKQTFVDKGKNRQVVIRWKNEADLGSPLPK